MINRFFSRFLLPFFFNIVLKKEPTSTLNLRKPHTDTRLLQLYY